MKYLLSFILSFLLLTSVSQVTFYQNTIKGRVSVRAFGIYDSSSVYIPVNSGDLINRAFLISTGHYNTYKTISYFNNNIVIWDSSSIITLDFIGSGIIVGAVAMRSHIIEVTSLINDTDTVFKLNTPWSNNNLYPPNVAESPRYRNFMLYLEYKNTSNSTITSSIVLNDIDASAITNYTIENLPPISNNFPVGFSMSIGPVPSNIGDGEYIYVNNDSLGLVHGTECCRPSGVGVIGQYDYYNNTLYGVGDDIPDSLVDSADVLADIKSYVNYGDTQINIEGRYEEPNLPQSSPNSNPIWATFLTYSTKCDTLKSSISISDTTICAGEVLNLAVGGDSTYTYAWRYRGNVVTTDSVLNIVPNENRLYSIMVSDTNGCSKTEIINIKVNQNPRLFIRTQDADCPNNNGAIVIDSVQGIAAPYRYRKDLGSWQTAPVYGGLSDGDYTINAIDTNSCMATEVVTVNELNNTVANFSYESPLPFIPIEVPFTNQSLNASEYQWFVNGDLVSNQTNLAQLFELAGVYTITLVASKPNEQCADTLIKKINLERENYLYLPSTWVKESPLNLYSIGYVKVAFRLLNGLGQVVHVISTPITSEEQNLLGNKNFARGVYFYELTAIKITGEEVKMGGKLIRM